MEKLNFNNKYLIVNRLLCIAVFSILCSCGSEKRNSFIYLYSKDKTQVVTIITYLNKKERVIANGKHTLKPKKDYYILDISNITELGDEIGVCWKTNGNEWEITNDKAKIIRTEIDTTKYIFRKSWFKDERGIPNAKYYRQPSCFTVGVLNYSNHFPEENGFVERVK